jgi:hypothetical protein
MAPEQHSRSVLSGSDAAVRLRKEAEIQERYEAAKRAALARIESHLGQSPRYEQFRTRLAEWIDAVR